MKTLPPMQKKGKWATIKQFETLLEEAKENKTLYPKVHRMYRRGPSQIAKKLGEEAVELVIASEKDNDADFLEESTDVLFYYLMALHARGYQLKDVLKILKKRIQP